MVGDTASVNCDSLVMSNKCQNEKNNRWMANVAHYFVVKVDSTVHAFNVIY